MLEKRGPGEDMLELHKVMHGVEKVEGGIFAPSPSTQIIQQMIRNRQKEVLYSMRNEFVEFMLIVCDHGHKHGWH